MTSPFNRARGEALRQQGMESAAEAGEELLVTARAIARQLARENNWLCNADMVGRKLFEDYGITTLGPAAGSLFKDGNWEQVDGVRTKSDRTKNHRRELRMWRLADHARSHGSLLLHRLRRNSR